MVPLVSLFAEWNRDINFEMAVREFNQNFYCKIFYDTQTMNVALVDTTSYSLDEFIFQVNILYDYLFQLTNYHKQRGNITEYNEGEIQGVLSCWNEFEFWQNALVMERNYEIFNGNFINEEGRTLNWVNVIRYFIYREYKKYIERRNIDV